jgi:hypothetical protein
MKLLLVALVAVFALGSSAEAAGAPKRNVHKRVKHSTRVSAGGTVTKKKTTTKSSTSGDVTKSTKKTVTKRTPSTKPR